MTRPRTRLSVVVACYNGERYLRRQLDSILAQTRPVDEIVVGDDGSTDATPEIIERYAGRRGPRFETHLHGRRLRTTAHFEFLLARATGDIVFLCDQDDIWHADKTARMADLLEQDPKALLAFSDGALVDQDEKPLAGTLWSRWRFTPRMQREWSRNSPRALDDLLHNNNKVTGATVGMKRTLLQHALPFALPVGYWHDAWLALHAMAHGGLRLVPEPLIDYRVHDAQQIGVSSSQGGQSYSEANVVSWEDFRFRLGRQYPHLRKVIEAEGYVGSDASAPRRMLRRLGLGVRAAVRASARRP